MPARNLALYAGLLSFAVMLERCSIRQRFWLRKINTIICASSAGAGSGRAAEETVW